MALVAAGADGGMIKRRREPGAGGVAVIALVGTGDVLRVFPRGLDAIVTRLATAEHLSVIHGERRRPEAGGVAILADGGGQNVLR